jgi:hypothetical protein
MKTLAQLTAETGLPVDPHLALDLTIPVSDGIQAQGDLLIAPLVELTGVVRVRPEAAWAEIPPEGVELLRGVAGGNAHTLTADPGTCLWTTHVTDVEGLTIGALDAMTTVYLLHREHGGAGIAPGRYVVRRQRELAPPETQGLRPDEVTHRQTPRGVAAAAAERANRPRTRYIAD